VENNLFTCSTDTQELIAEKIREHNLNRIVVAACTPRTHEPLFQDTLREAGLNPYLIEMANIRNHNAWVHQKEPEKATEKAKDQVAMAVARVAENFPLERGKVDVVQKALVVGAGISGMTAALEIADQGFETVLIEKSDVLGGNARLLNQTWRGEDVSRMLRDLISRVEKNQKIRLFTNAVLKSCSGSVGNFTSDVDINGKIVTVEYGAAVIATGAVEYRPNEYQFSKDRRIMTHLEFDAEIRDNESAVKTSNSVVFIHCVGSREQERPYCSRFCCSHSLISAVNLKKLNPAMNVYILFRDIRAYGEREDLYREARLLGVSFIRYEPENKPSVTVDNQSLEIRVFHTGFQRTIKIPADYLVLASAVVPRKENEIAELFKCTTNKGGFIEEAHPKLRPVDTPVDGIFVAGLCNYPKPIDESIAQARAAAARAGVILAKDEMRLDAIKSYVTDNCDGCALCVDVCPYQAIRLEEYEVDGIIHKKDKCRWHYIHLGCIIKF
jgi:heterodisulfide reductase subunit A